jgi:rod shape-determining protein MreD
MNRIIAYLLLAGCAVILQTVLLPPLLPDPYKPDLLLLLVVYLGLYEEPWRGGALVYLIGWMYDGAAGVFPGLHGYILLGIFFAVRATVTRVNTESSVLLLCLVTAGTVLQSVLLAFALEFFLPAVDYWPSLVLQLPAQLLINMLAALLLLRLVLRLQRTFNPRKELPGLRKLDSRYES